MICAKYKIPKCPLAIYANINRASGDFQVKTYEPKYFVLRKYIYICNMNFF